LSEEHPLVRSVSVLALTETRRFVRDGHARMAVVFFAVLYALGSMLLGGMLILSRVPGGYTSVVLWGNVLGSGSWNYPGLLIVAPWGVLSLPFLATISMVLVSVGVGLGVAVAILISVRLVRDRRAAAAGAGGVGSIAGLTPAMIALVTLGACCSTTAAATAGVGIVAQASGSTLNNLLINNWFLDVFQVSVVYVALLAQELILRVYGGLFGLTAVGSGASNREPRVPRASRAAVAAGAVRAMLLLAGLTWSLAMFAEWAGASPPFDSAALWFQWVVQHQLLGDFAVAVALIPALVAGALAGAVRSPSRWLLRGGLLVGGLSLIAWTPPIVAAGGAPGLVNEVLGVVGLPASWGAVSPVFGVGPALIARWAFQYLLLGGFAVAAAVWPDRVLRALVVTDAWPRAAPLAPREERSSRGSSPSDRSAPPAPTTGAPSSVRPTVRASRQE
jgi:hypothetical protein